MVHREVGRPWHVVSPLRLRVAQRLDGGRAPCLHRRRLRASAHRGLRSRSNTGAGPPGPCTGSRPTLRSRAAMCRKPSTFGCNGTGRGDSLGISSASGSSPPGFDRARPGRPSGRPRPSTDPGLPFGATGRGGCAAVFGLQASRTGGSVLRDGASIGLSEPDKPRTCLPRHSRVAADTRTAWNRRGGTTSPGGVVGALCAADIRTNRSKAHGSIGPDRVETP